MKIKDIVSENTKPSPPKEITKPSTGEWLFRDEGVDRMYNLNRVMMAAAKHDGKSNNPVEMDKSSWVEKYNTARPYTEEEHRMMQGAFKTVGADAEHSISNHRSREQDDTHKVSPVQDRGPIKRKS